MRHKVDGRKFGMNTSHRVAMLRTLANNVIRHEQVITTVAKAKEGRRVADRLITLGKMGTLHAKRLAFDRTRDRENVVKLFGTLAERYAKRAGGYTRVLRMDGTRWGDGAERAILELVDRPLVERKKKVKKTKDEAHEHADGEKHTHTDKKAAPHAHAEAGGKSKISGGTAKAAGGKSAGLRKTPTKSGGGRSSGSS